MEPHPARRIEGAEAGAALFACRLTGLSALAPYYARLAALTQSDLAVPYAPHAKGMARGRVGLEARMLRLFSLPSDVAAMSLISHRRRGELGWLAAGSSLLARDGAYLL
jgi:hypothetical protein